MFLHILACLRSNPAACGQRQEPATQEEKQGGIAHGVKKIPSEEGVCRFLNSLVHPYWPPTDQRPVPIGFFRSSPKAHALRFPYQNDLVNPTSLRLAYASASTIAADRSTVPRESPLQFRPLSPFALRGTAQEGYHFPSPGNVPAQWAGNTTPGQ